MSTYTNRKIPTMPSVQFKSGRTRSRRKKAPSNLAANYAMMLQLYLIHKQQAKAMDLKYVSLTRQASRKSTLFSPAAGIFSKLVKAFEYINRESKTRLTIATD